MQPLEIHEAHRIITIELAAYTVAEYGKMFRHTPAYRENDDIRAIRLKLMNEALIELLKAIEE